MTKTSDKILEKIKKKGVMKTAKWRFVLKRFGIWITLVLAVLLSALALSMIIFHFAVVDFDVHMRLGRGLVGTLVEVMPYFWILISIVLFVFVYYDFKNTKKGYRYSGVLVILASIGLAILLGVCAFYLRVSEYVEEFVEHLPPPFHHMQPDTGSVWQFPEEGLLGGEIIAFMGAEVVILEDLSQEIWSVDITAAEISKKVEFEIGERIKVIGEAGEDGWFFAKVVRAWHEGGPLQLFK